MPAKTRRAVNDSKVVVVSLEGCHGCGKTALCAEFAAQGYQVLDEAFLDMPSYALHPQSLLMETSWVCSWFERVLRIADQAKRAPTADARRQVYIADRSPFSAVLYSANGKLLEPVIRAQMKEVQQFASVQFYNVHVQVDRGLLWQRITERLMVEPERVRYNEHKQEWMDHTLAFYNAFPWDLTVTNDERGVQDITDRITSLLAEQDPDFRAVYERTKQQRRHHPRPFDVSLLSTDCESDGSADDPCPVSSPETTPVKQSSRSIISFNNAATEGL